MRAATHTMAPLQCLVVENEQLVAAGLAQMLCDLGHEVCGVAEDVAALATCLGATTPDLIAMDLDLGNGKEGLGLGTLIEATGPIPIVYVAETADRTARDSIRSMEGAALLLRPFTSNDLSAAVDRAMKRASSERGLRVDNTRRDAGA